MTHDAPVRLRTGVFPAVNTVLSLVFLVVFLAVTGIAVAAATAAGSARPVSTGNAVWAGVAAVIGLVAVAVMVSWLIVSLTGLRAVIVHSGPGGTVSLPVVRHAFVPTRLVLPLAQITAMLEMGGGTRNRRWRLVVRAPDGSRIACDSLTSSRRATADTSATPAGRAVRRLDDLARTARA